MLHASSFQMSWEIQAICTKIAKIYQGIKMYVTLYIWYIASVDIFIIFIALA